MIAQPVQKTYLMADHYDADVSGLAYPQKGTPNLCLGNRVQHGSHFIGDKVSGLWVQSSYDAETLQFPAG
jgi:hypothetical protein